MLTTIKVYAYSAVKIYKVKPPKNIKRTGGGAPDAPVLDPPLVYPVQGHSVFNPAICSKVIAMMALCSMTSVFYS